MHRRPRARRRTRCRASRATAQPFAHPEQPEAGRARMGIEALAVVAHHHVDGARLLADADLHPGGPRMLDRVGQGLLDDAVDRSTRPRPGAGSPPRRHRCRGRTRASTARSDCSADARDQRLERGLDAELVERRRPQVRDQRTQIPDAGLEMLDRLADRGLQPLPITAAPRARRAAHATRRAAATSRRATRAPSGCAPARTPPGCDATPHRPRAAPWPPPSPRSRRTPPAAARPPR